MKIDILTIFPSSFSYLNESIIKRARQKDLVEINIVDLRAYSKSKHKNVDDKPFGGGAGMIMQIEPIYLALKDILSKVKSKRPYVVLTSAGGTQWNQKKALDFAKGIEHLVIICGHYEGVDYRVVEHLVDEEVSIGSFVLSGGELAAQVMIDTIVRLIPGSLGNEQSLKEESHSDDIIKEYPQYTRPAVFKPQEEQDWAVPEVLLNGNHKEIEEWRKKNTLIRGE